VILVVVAAISRSATQYAIQSSLGRHGVTGSRQIFARFLVAHREIFEKILEFETRVVEVFETLFVRLSMDARARHCVQLVQRVMPTGPKMGRQDLRGIFDLGVHVMAVFDLFDPLSLLCFEFGEPRGLPEPTSYRLNPLTLHPILHPAKTQSQLTSLSFQTT
jgi:hypothetical protein